MALAELNRIPVVVDVIPVYLIMFCSYMLNRNINVTNTIIYSKNLNTYFPCTFNFCDHNDNLDNSAEKQQ